MPNDTQLVELVKLAEQVRAECATVARDAKRDRERAVALESKVDSLRDRVAALETAFAVSEAEGAAADKGRIQVREWLGWVIATIATIGAALWAAFKDSPPPK